MLNHKILIPVFLLAIAGGLFLPDLVTATYSQVSGIRSEYSTKPNVIIIDVDRLSAHRMPCYGYERNTTPNMCRFGENNIMFEDAVSQSGWTGSGVASIFTSQYPDVHNLTSYRDSLPEDRVTMAEVLKQEGYSTVAYPSYSGNDEAQLQRGYQLDQGFEDYVVKDAYLRENNPRVIEDLRLRDEPFFSYIQAWGPHSYAALDAPPPSIYTDNLTSNLEEVREINPDTNLALTSMSNGSYYIELQDGERVDLVEKDVRHIENRYDDSLRFTDRYFGELIDQLKEQGTYSESIIIVTADHGEILDTKTLKNNGNRRFAHGKVYEDTNVPLMIHLPEGKETNVESKVELIDLMPTVFDELGLELNESMDRRMQGESLRPLYNNLGITQYDSDYTYTFSHRADRYGVSNTTWKLVQRGIFGTELYNLEEDPLQTEDVADKYPEITEDLKSRLDNQLLRNQKLRTDLYRD